MSNDFRESRREAGLPPERVSGAKDTILRGSPMEDMTVIMAAMRKKAERAAAQKHQPLSQPDNILPFIPRSTSSR